MEISTKFIVANTTSVGKNAIRIAAVYEIESLLANRFAILNVSRIVPIEKIKGKTMVANSFAPKIKKEKTVINK